MHPDSYTLAISLDELVALARKYGRDCVSGDVEACARRSVEQVLCPCIRGADCVCEAIADEFLRLAMAFRAKSERVNPGHFPWEEIRWENEGGRLRGDGAT